MLVGCYVYAHRIKSRNTSMLHSVPSQLRLSSRLDYETMLKAYYRRFYFDV
jgi:hypothetical protein